MIDLKELYQLCKNPPSEKDWIKFWKKVNPGEWKDCWEWQGRRVNGYGLFTSYMRGGGVASRVVCSWIFGSLPQWLVCDHVGCDNPPCVNPLHLIPTTHSNNSRRGALHNKKKTHCPKGHKLVTGNLDAYHLSKGRRRCKVCHNMSCVKYRKRRKEKVNVSPARDNLP